MSAKHSYHGNLQERLRNLSIRTNCPTRQENGQRYLGPPINWIEKAPSSAEIFISKLPADCYEDEIYDFCSRVGKIYLIRLMINFENENRGFCFVTFSSAKEAEEAVVLLPQSPLRKGHFVHAEISFNNCTLKMYGLDFRWNDENLEQEIRTNTKDVVNVTIKRNMAQRTLMATLYFDTHQKAAIARRKLSQIANSRWGQNVKVFLWSKKLQNKGSNKQESSNEKNYSPRKKSMDKYDDESPQKDDHGFDSHFIHFGLNEEYKSSPKNYTPDNSPFPDFSSPWSNQSMFSPSKQLYDPVDHYSSGDLFSKPNNAFDFNNNKSPPSPIDHFKKMDDAVKTLDSPPNFELFSSCESSHMFSSVFGTTPPSSYCTRVTDDSPVSSFFSYSNESSPQESSKYHTSQADLCGIYGAALNWNNDSDHRFDKSYFNDYQSESTDSFYANVPEKQIETILQEALEALVLNKCDEPEQHFLL